MRRNGLSKMSSNRATKSVADFSATLFSKVKITPFRLKRRDGAGLACAISRLICSIVRDHRQPRGFVNDIHVGCTICGQATSNSFALVGKLVAEFPDRHCGLFRLLSDMHRAANFQ